MRKFNFSRKEQLVRNVFAFIQGKRTILFNRLNFQRKYIENKTHFNLIDKSSQGMENESPEIKFSLPPLRKIRVEAGLKCNCACDYCLVFKNELSQINDLMNKNTAEKIIAFYKNHIKNGSLMITGGEPLLNWSVVKLFIERIKDSIKIFTNGTIIRQEIIDTLRHHKNVRLIISLDGRRDENKMRKFSDGREIYPLVIKNLRKFQKNHCNLGIACLCTSQNVNKLYEIVKFFVKNLKIKYLGISFPHYILKNTGEIANFDIEEYTKQMMRIFDFAVKNRVYVDQLAKRFSPLITGKFRLYACKLLGEQITFYPDGKETLCTKIDCLRNPKKNNLKYFQNIIPINNKFCQNCPAIGICGGGCFWDGIIRFNHGVDERECFLNNSLLNYFLWKIYSSKKEKIPLRERFSSLIIK